jgi:uncharacterized damage-inducible protein DinB
MPHYNPHMHDHFARLFLYDTWANAEEVRVMRASATVPPKAREVLAHVVAAGLVWVQRLSGGEAPAVWPEWTLDEIDAEGRRLGERWRQVIPSLDLTATVAYTNTKGERFTSVAADILTHVAMHGAYHRGQIATLLRAADQAPAFTDFIHCTRMGFIR